MSTPPPAPLPPRCDVTALKKPPHQFKNFKYEMPEAVDGRKRVKDLGNDVKTHEKKIKVRDCVLQRNNMIFRGNHNYIIFYKCIHGL